MYDPVERIRARLDDEDRNRTDRADNGQQKPLAVPGLHSSRRGLLVAAAAGVAGLATVPTAAADAPTWHGGGAIAVIRDQEADLTPGSGSVRIYRGYLPDGGYLAIHDAERLLERSGDFGLIGITDHIEAGDHWNIDVDVSSGATWADDHEERRVIAIPYRDRYTPYTHGWKAMPDFHTANGVATVTSGSVVATSASPSDSASDSTDSTDDTDQPETTDDGRLGSDTQTHISRHGLPTPVAHSEFDDVSRVSAVDDLGLDPTGGTPIGSALESALDNGTIVSFEPGTYRVASGFNISNRENVGLVAPSGATLELDAGLTDYDLSFRNCRNLLFSGFELDQSAQPCSAQVSINVTGRSLLQDVGFVGYADSDDSGKKIGFNVRDSDGVLTLRRVIATDGTQVGRAGMSANDHKHLYDGGFWAGPPHTGTAYLIDCQAGLWSDNGLYASRTNGGIVVDGGYYGNSSISQVRLGHPESFVGGGARIEVDRDTIPERNNPDGLGFTRGIWLESGSLGNAGATVGEVAIRVGDVDAFGGCIAVSSSATGARIVGPVDIDAPSGIQDLNAKTSVDVDDGAIVR